MHSHLLEVKNCLPIVRDILSDLELILLQIVATILVIKHFLPRRVVKND
jgi:hypothetical protein